VSRKKTESDGDAAVVSLQQWLSSQGQLGGAAITGIYDQRTHDAVKRAAGVLGGKPDHESQKAADILSYLHEQPINQIKADPKIVTSVVFELQSVLPKKQKQQDPKNTMFVQVELGGKAYMLPLTMVWNRGAPMYRAILEQEGLLNSRAPAEEREQQLNAALQAIKQALPPTDQANENLLSAIIVADQQLRNMWSPESSAAASGGAYSLAQGLGGLVPEFNKATDLQKGNIISAIFYRFPRAENFISDPPTLSSKIIDLQDFRRRTPDLISFVSHELRRMGLLK
jgi:preprotein translocase subunit Sec61beta